MANPQFDQEEARFLHEIGLVSDDLSALVADAPDMPDDVTARVLAQVRRKAPGRRPSQRFWYSVAAAAAGILLVGTLVTTGAASALVERLYRLVPGMGVVETSDQTLVLAQPVAIEQAGHEMKVLGLLSNQTGTLVRLQWTGATDAKVIIVQRPWLVLPDGTRLQTPGGNSSRSGGGLLTWHITFPSLPAGTTSVRLELPPIAGITTETATADLPLTADVSGLTPAMSTNNPSVERNGVTVSVPSIALGPDTIQVALDLKGAPGVYPKQLGNVALYDDLGNQFRLDRATADFAYRSGMPSSFTFTGPVQPGAKRLKLSIESVITLDSGSAEVQVNVGDLPVGDTMALDQTVALGPTSFRIREATRLEEGKFRLILEPGTTAEGHRLYAFGTSSPNHSNDYAHPALLIGVPPNAITLELYGPPVDGIIRFNPISPGVVRQGPYDLEIPLQ